jgi:hypothetical protein
MYEAAEGAEGRISNGSGVAGVPIDGNKALLSVYAPSGAFRISGRSGGGTMGTAGTTGFGGGRRGRKAVGGGMYSSILVDLFEYESSLRCLLMYNDVRWSISRYPMLKVIPG